MNRINSLLPTRIDTKLGGVLVKREDIQYPGDIPSPSAAEQLLYNSNQQIPLIKHTSNSIGGRIWQNRMHYGTQGNRPVLNGVTAGPTTHLEERIKILHSDVYGNPVEVQVDGVTTIYLWGYQGTYLMAEIQGASYTQVESALGRSPLTLSDEINPSSYITIMRPPLRLLGAFVNSYTYDPVAGLTSKTDSRGITEYYSYDNFQRLKRVLDYQYNILKDYQYNYRNN